MGHGNGAPKGKQSSGSYSPENPKGLVIQSYLTSLQLLLPSLF